MKKTASILLLPLHVIMHMLLHLPRAWSRNLAQSDPQTRNRLRNLNQVQPQTWKQSRNLKQVQPRPMNRHWYLNQSMLRPWPLNMSRLIPRLPVLLLLLSLSLPMSLLFLSLSPFAFPQAGVRAQSVDTFRVLSYNIQTGRGIDEVYDFRRIADVIIDSGADLVALQEVDSGVDRSGRVDIMQILADYTGMEPLFYKNAEIQGGEYGNGILTRFPVIDAGNIHLPGVGDSEQRGLMHVMVDVGGREIAFMNTHLDHRPPDEERLQGVDVITRLKRRYSGMPVILAGDLNARPGSEVHRRMKSGFQDLWEVKGEGDGFTFHTSNPDRRIDYIFYSNEGADEAGYRLEPVSVEVIWSDGSDHLPVLGVFVIE